VRNSLPVAQSNPSGLPNGIREFVDTARSLA
jgi:hypothetical protein